MFLEEELAKINQHIEHETKTMNLSTVRLCFQTYLPNELGHFVNCLKPVYSHQIYDSSKYITICCWYNFVHESWQSHDLR